MDARDSAEFCLSLLRERPFYMQAQTYLRRGLLHDTIPKMKVSQKAPNPPTTALHRRFSHNEYYQNSAV